MKLLKFNVFVLLAMLLGGCTGTPEKVTPVGSFELNRYLGPGTKSLGLTTVSNAV